MAVAIYVATDGDDDGPGTEQAPFATLQRARKAVRKLKAARRAEGGVTVWLRGGVYELSSTFKLGKKDSGTPGSPVTYAAYPGEHVRLSGGRVIPSSWFQPVSDPEMLDRIQPALRDKVLCADLRAMGIADFGDLGPRGFGNMSLSMPTALYCNDQPMTLARWPVNGYARTSLRPDSLAPAPGNSFIFANDRLKQWTTATDPWVYGFWCWDWADEYLPVHSINVQNHTITTGRSHPFGIQAERRFYIANLIEELDQPGEWYLDRTGGVLFFYPPCPLRDARVVMSVLTDPLVFLDRCSFVSLQGLTLECSRGVGIRIREGEHNLVAGCTLRNLSGPAVQIGEPWRFDNAARNVRGGKNNGVQSCDIYHVGGCGIILGGGDRKSLQAAGNFAVNNHIHHFSQICRTYQPAIELGGVGNRIANNRIHHAPHFAVWLSGNDHVIELNHISNVAEETDDAAAIYAGRNPSEQGNVIRYNYFHDIGSHLGHGTAAIYMDDGECGALITGNIFFRAGNMGSAGFGAIFIHGGKDNVVEDNIFIDCEVAIGLESWGEKAWQDFLGGRYENGLIPKRIYGKEVDIRKSPYKEHYPALRRLEHEAGRNHISRNFALGCRHFILGQCGKCTDNVEHTLAPVGQDQALLDFLLENYTAALEHVTGFKTIPLRKIGLHEDRFRKFLSE